MTLGAARVMQRAGEEVQDYRGAARVARELVGPGGLVVGAGPGGAFVRAYDPRALEAEGWSLPDEGGPLAVVVPFPAWTPAAQRARLEAGFGLVVLPGRVSPVAVWVRPL